jgi:hypothetical protein
MSNAMNPMKCPRCETDLRYVGTKAFHEGTRWGVLGEVMVHRDAWTNDG